MGGRITLHAQIGDRSNRAVQVLNEPGIPEQAGDSVRRA
jgi:hypothetical protein